jgi:hypothetical protein
LHHVCYSVRNENALAMPSCRPDSDARRCWNKCKLRPRAFEVSVTAKAQAVAPLGSSMPEKALRKVCRSMKSLVEGEPLPKEKRRDITGLVTPSQDQIDAA